MIDEELLARNPEVRRLILLWEEGLLCRRCHSELGGVWEVELGICHPCVQEENDRANAEESLSQELAGD